MHKLHRTPLKLFWLPILLLLASACGPRFPENRYESPSEYYLYVPDNYEPDGEFYLFVALHGHDQDGADCYEEWWRYAREVRFVLLCPTMPVDDEGYDRSHAESQLAAILTEVYSRYTFANQFFLAGYEAGADFALPYAYRYPSAVIGVAVIGPRQLPSTASAYNIPALLMVGEEETDQRQATEAFSEVLQGAGYTIRLIVVSGLEESLSADARRTSVDLYRDLTYRTGN
jgi:poly(3-hydroxybutyrate) depolymerase